MRKSNLKKVKTQFKSKILFCFVTIICLITYPFGFHEASAKSKWTKYDIRTQPSKELTAKKINKVLKKKGKSAKARNSNIGDIIMKESKAHGISPSVLFSMFVIETGWGSSKLFKNHNNVGGLTCMKGYKCTGNWTHFNSVKSSFHKKAEILSGKLYVESGRVKLGQVLSRYASPSNASSYSAKVGSIMQNNLHQKYVSKNFKKIHKTNHD